MYEIRHYTDAKGNDLLTGSITPLRERRSFYSVMVETKALKVWM